MRENTVTRTHWQNNIHKCAQALMCMTNLHGIANEWYHYWSKQKLWDTMAPSRTVHQGKKNIQLKKQQHIS